MVFSNVFFITFFLPISIIVYYLVADKFKIYTLLFLSVLFYSFNSVYNLLIIMGALIINIVLIMGIRKFPDKIKKYLLIIGILFNAGLLILYKYINLFVDDKNSFCVIPVGLSFFTFKAISCLVDLYNGKISMDTKLSDLAAYLLFFPQILSGPISAYSDFLDNKAKKEYFLENITEGIPEFILGFSKKVLLADMLGRVANEIFSLESNQLSSSLCWLGAVTFSLELYYDFSGYSNMAIGISRMLGYACPVNFDSPYISRSVTEFWRRWHITLGEWFKKYVYFPLGGSKVGKPRMFLNILIVWFLTGIWHGSDVTFLIWGMLNCVMVLFEKVTNISKGICSRCLSFFYYLVTLLFIIMQWTVFRVENYHQMLFYFKAMFAGVNEIADKRAIYLMSNYLVVYLAAVIFCFPIKKIINKIDGNKVVSTMLAVVMFLIFMIAVSFSFAINNMPFIYSNF